MLIVYRDIIITDLTRPRQTFVEPAGSERLRRLMWVSENVRCNYHSSDTTLRENNQFIREQRYEFMFNPEVQEEMIRLFPPHAIEEGSLI